MGARSARQLLARNKRSEPAVLQYSSHGRQALGKERLPRSQSAIPGCRERAPSCGGTGSAWKVWVGSGLQAQLPGSWADRPSGEAEGGDLL